MLPRVAVWIAVLASMLTQQHKTADWFFDDPAALCRVLSDYKIGPSEWASPNYNRNIGPFFCEGTPEIRDESTPEGKVFGTLFRVSGDTKARADIISLSITIMDPSDAPIAQRDMKRYLETIFKAIDQPEPIALVRSIDAGREYQATQSYGVVWFNVVKPMFKPTQPVYWFRLSKRSLL